MSREVNIQVLDVVSATYPKTLLKNEPVVIRNFDAIDQIGFGVHGVSKRFAVTVNSADLTVTSDADIRTQTENLHQLITVSEVKQLIGYLNNLDCGTTAT